MREKKLYHNLDWLDVNGLKGGSVMISRDDAEGVSTGSSPVHSSVTLVPLLPVDHTGKQTEGLSAWGGREGEGGGERRRQEEQEN